LSPLNIREWPDAQIACFVGPARPISRGTVFGGELSQTEFAIALARGTPNPERVVFVTNLGQDSTFSNLLRNQISGPWPRVISIERSADILRQSTVWHDAIGSSRAFRLRAQLGLTKKAVVTTTPHCLSYAHLRRSLFGDIIRSGTQNYDRVFANSRASAIATAKLFEMSALDEGAEFEGSIEICPLGVESRFGEATAEARKIARRRLRIPANALVLLAQARRSATDKSDLAPLFAAVKQLVHRFPNLLLLVVGPELTDPYELGDSESRLADCIRTYGIENNVQFLGLVPDSARHSTYACADIFVSLADSLQETLGRTPLEAMSAGIPQVLSDWDGYRDSAVDGQTGFLIPTYWDACDRDLTFADFGSPWQPTHLALAQSVVVDTRILLTRLESLLRSQALRAEMAHNSVRRAHGSFTWDAVLPSYGAAWADAHRQRLSAVSTFSSEHKAAGRGTKRAQTAAASYSDVFSAYPTRMDALDLHVRRGVLPENAVAMLIRTAPTILDPAALEKDSKTASEALAANESMRLRDLLASPNDEDGAAMRRLLWLFKQGILESAATGGA
jgi:glycosyltransferase involved in cell wall biosynthesis